MESIAPLVRRLYLWRPKEPPIRRVSAKGGPEPSSVSTLITPPEALPYSAEEAPRRTSIRRAELKSRLSSWVCPSGELSGMPSTSSLTSRTPKADRVPNPRMATRWSCAKLKLFWTKTPGTRRSASSMVSVGSRSRRRDQSIVEMAAADAELADAVRDAVTTISSRTTMWSGEAFVCGAASVETKAPAHSRTRVNIRPIISAARIESRGGKRRSFRFTRCGDKRAIGAKPQGFALVNNRNSFTDAASAVSAERRNDHATVIDCSHREHATTRLRGGFCNSCEALRET